MRDLQHWERRAGLAIETMRHSYRAGVSYVLLQFIVISLLSVFRQLSL